MAVVVEGVGAGAAGEGMLGVDAPGAVIGGEGGEGIGLDGLWRSGGRSL